MNGAKRKKKVCIYVARIANNTLKHLSTLSACCNLLGHTYTRIHTPKNKTNKKLFFLLLFLFNFNRIAAIILFFPFRDIAINIQKSNEKQQQRKCRANFNTHTHTHTKEFFIEPKQNFTIQNGFDLLWFKYANFQYCCMMIDAIGFFFFIHFQFGSIYCFFFSNLLFFFNRDLFSFFFSLSFSLFRSHFCLERTVYAAVSFPIRKLQIATIEIDKSLYLYVK